MNGFRGSLRKFSLRMAIGYSILFIVSGIGSMLSVIPFHVVALLALLESLSILIYIASDVD